MQGENLRYIGVREMHKIYPLCRISGEKCVRGGGRNGGQCDKWRKRKVADTNFLEKKIGC